MTGSRQTRSLQRSDQRFREGDALKAYVGALAREVARQGRAKHDPFSAAFSAFRVGNALEAYVGALARDLA